MGPTQSDELALVQFCLSARFGDRARLEFLEAHRVLPRPEHFTSARARLIWQAMIDGAPGPLAVWSVRERLLAMPTVPDETVRHQAHAWLGGELKFTLDIDGKMVREPEPRGCDHDRAIAIARAMVGAGPDLPEAA